MAVETCDKTSLGESSAAYHSGWTIVTGASGSIGAALTEGLAKGRTYPETDHGT